MTKQIVSYIALGLIIACSSPPNRNCTDFKTGSFSFTAEIDGEKKTTTFIRDENIEIDLFEGKRDTSSIRWINDCEYILKNKNPKSKAEEKSIHIKILTTADSSYTFEYNAIGESRKFKGTAYKIH
ncbi:DNA topoisomerase IV [Flagellimonas allohymeniacidonis]|uniref:DNA topoisomerase IV n=1 Tax=Flagellimonas allohymeniacidonis TaxID=2517819 RepID=A0A4Q8QHF8_9FLAO|nr:DNA topoisomerase IV [Allomuricauda hymeniacidonis]TAI48718.1 DNA topoisomerase IV [Allomuricauda hymeniacidonis]